MKFVLLCVGALKASPEKELLSQYQVRLSWPLEIQEIVCRKHGSANQVKDWEGDLLLQALGPGVTAIGLDEGGSSITSVEFAHILKAYQDEGAKSLAFIIGGADGLSEPVKNRCQRLISFGRMTWPHLLARGMLIEQLYRAQQILMGHPYHRA